MHSGSEIENLVFAQIAARFEKDGYEFIHEHEAAFPTSVVHYRPDLIAKRNDEYVAVEIKARRTPSGERSLERIRKQIEKDKKWKFQVFYADEILAPKPLPKADRGTIMKILEEVQEAAHQGHTRAAFLLSWGAFEAVARSNHSRIFSKPQTPGRIITILSERGEITHGQAEKLRMLAQIRNSIVHGEFGIDVQKSDVEFMANTVGSLRGID